MNYNPYTSVLAGIAFLLCLGASQATAQVISTPEAREALLDRAERLVPVSPDVMVERFAEAVDPFYPKAPDEGETPEEPVRKGPSDRDILEALAERVRPSGIMATGGEQVLLFGERRVRAGDVLQLSYGGEPRRIVVAAVGQRSFTLRFGEEEISKPVQ